ncbi:MAG: putative toxin-antitoxin system toxin component, PIN family [Acidobacteria bacterium]|nr:putative toxin-antitoxin system toxin component, PIN family [Acidobacteriota bacterium]
MRAVLDTNVIISRYLTPHGRVARIVDLWEADAFELIVSEVILSEYGRVLRYPRHRRVHRLTDTQLAELDDAFREFSELITPDETPAVIEDERDDDHFLAAAAAGRVDGLVTGDPHLLKLGIYRGIPILRPADFLARYFHE